MGGTERRLLGDKVAANRALRVDGRFLIPAPFNSCQVWRCG